MANSDKNILITPNVGAATGTNPTIRFTGADNTPITLRVLDNGTVSFEGTAGQLFSIADGLTGTIFSVNDISGIPSIEVLDTGLIKLGQYNGQTVIGGAAAVSTAELSVFPSAAANLGLVVKGATSQSGDLQQWRNSTDGVLASISSAGSLTVRPAATQDGVVLAGRAGGTSSFAVTLTPATLGASRTLTLPDATGTVALTANNLGAFASTTSAQLAGVISDETGSGALVFGTSPAITTSLTTPSTSFDLLNTTATTVNFAGAATALTIGATTGTTNVRNDMNLATGKMYKINNTNISAALPALTWGDVKNGKSGMTIS